MYIFHRFFTRILLNLLIRKRILEASKLTKAYRRKCVFLRGARPDRCWLTPPPLKKHISQTRPKTRQKTRILHITRTCEEFKTYKQYKKATSGQHGAKKEKQKNTPLQPPGSDRYLAENGRIVKDIRENSRRLTNELRFGHLKARRGSYETKSGVKGF